ncbi:helix-turn-helix domain-containing protein [Aneurinibacillus sp. BA2021]|nr:helix-turn-helix domain-containing protein [Aneurinibacillus sp. BA2021]
MKRKYSREFKCKVVQQVLACNKPGSIARQHRINSITIYRWINEYKQGKYDMGSV